MKHFIKRLKINECLKITHYIVLLITKPRVMKIFTLGFCLAIIVALFPSSSTAQTQLQKISSGINQAKSLFGSHKKHATIPNSQQSTNTSQQLPNKNTNNVSSSTSAPNSSNAQITDIDGHQYKTVKIGTQEWMAEDLNVTHFRNGDPIPNITEKWQNPNYSADTIYYFDVPGSTSYKLYNWYAVNDPRGLAPTGWHVPTEPDLMILANYLGGHKVAGGKMKSTDGWRENGNGTNESGFAGLPHGSYFDRTEFGGFGQYGWWWSSSTRKWGDPIPLLLSSNSDILDLTQGGAKTTGLSVRLVKDGPIPNIERGQVTDIDGHKYKTVKIGNQEWMAENLNVSHYRNGDRITEIKDPKAWEVNGYTNRKPAWSYYDNDSANGSKYGKLYNWYAVVDPRGLAPKGWHVATVEDVGILANYLGGMGDGVDFKMKSTFGWGPMGNLDENGNNESGFTGLPGGMRGGEGLFGGIGSFGYWVSSSKSGTYGTMYDLESTDFDWPDTPIDTTRLEGGTGEAGLSVRCVKD